MGGLTVGSAIIGRRAPEARGLLSTYAAVEGLVAVSGVALTHALPGLTQIVVALTGPRLDDPWTANVIRFATAFVILLVPSSAMGASLPKEIFERALGHLEKVHPDYAKGVRAAMAAKTSAKIAAE